MILHSLEILEESRKIFDSEREEETWRGNYAKDLHINLIRDAEPEPKALFGLRSEPEPV